MGKIAILPPLIAERIAAGEVIERPASVIKELVENSIDAGSTEIEVRVIGGGIELMEVTDNGSGLSREDLEVCIARHATSKIKVFEDLSHLSSLGFRGEALPSIASVAELEIESRVAGATETFKIRVAQSTTSKTETMRIANLSFLGQAHGTRVRVTSLFSQIPARLKFLKSQGAETNAIREVLERLALTHPEIHFRLISQEKTVFDLPSESLKDRATRMLSDDNPFEVCEVTLPGSYGIQMIWLRGLSIPHTRSLYQIVNGRSVRDRTLQMAILNPLKQSFLPGHYPALVVKLNVPASDLDVNVSPSKTEIRFLNSGKIFALCQAGIERLLEDSTPMGQVGQGITSSDNSTFSSVSGHDYLLSPSFQFPPRQNTSSFTPSLSSSLSVQTPEFVGGVSNTSFLENTLGEYRGTVFSTYFIFEKGDSLLFIDQHAAHERIRYEKLKKSILKKEKPEGQALLVPEVIKVKPGTLISFQERLPLLHSLGFDVEIFGEDALVFRTVPALWGKNALGTRLKGLTERLIEENLDLKSLAWDETLFEKIAMEACRSSFKAGDFINRESAIDLTEKLFQCEHPGNCPHGRPTFITVKASKVEEWFSRLS